MQDQEKTREELLEELNTLRQQIAHDLSVVDQEIRYLLNTIHAVVFRFQVMPDGTQKVLYVNSAVEDILQTSVQSILKDSAQLWEKVVTSDIPHVYESMAESYKTKTPWHSEFRLLHRDGTVHWVYAEAVPEQTLGDGIIWNAILSDITERKQSEEALRLYRDQLEEVVQKRTQKLELEISERHQAEETLRKNQQKYRAMFHQTFQFGGLLSLDGILLEANETVLKFGGMTEKEVLYKPFWETEWFRHSESVREEIRSAVQKAAHGELVRFETTAVGKDGDLIELDVSIKPLYDEEGRMIYLIPEGRDISERRRLERELKKNRDFLELQIKRMPIGYIMWDDQFRVLTWNPAAEKIFGFSESEALGKHPYDLIVPRSLQPEIDEIWHRLLEGDAAASSINQNVTRDGQRIVCDWKNTPIKDYKGEVAGVLSMVIDITERKRMEDALREEKQKLRSVIDGSPMSAFFIDRNHKIIYWNKAIENFSGLKAADMIGTSNQWKPFYSEPRPCMADLLLDQAFKDIPHWYPEIHKKSDLIEGGYEATRFFPSFGQGGKWLHLMAIAIKDPLGEIIGAFEAVEDITERKKAEEELQKAMDIRARFTSIVSHEVRTPLAAMKMGVEALLDGLSGAVTETQNEMLCLFKRNIDRLSRLVTSILNYEALQSGQIAFRCEETDIRELVEDVYEAFKLMAEAKGVAFSMAVEEGLPPLMMDRDKINEVLTNLVNNALKFTSEGSVQIHVTREKDEVHFRVCDTGPGIKAEDLPRMYENFKQLETTRGFSSHGTGLGLPISKEIVLRHRGKIWTESEFGKGSVFHFSLPLNPSSIKS